MLLTPKEVGDDSTNPYTAEDYQAMLDEINATCGTTWALPDANRTAEMSFNCAEGYKGILCSACVSDVQHATRVQRCMQFGR
jgi:hypothetical protein